MKPKGVYYFKWIFADWNDSESVEEMDARERGVYISMLSRQPVNGSLPAELKKLAKQLKLSLSEVNSAWPILKRHFEEFENEKGEKRLINRKIQELLESVKNELEAKGRKRSNGEDTGDCLSTDSPHTGSIVEGQSTISRSRDSDLVSISLSNSKSKSKGSAEGKQKPEATVLPPWLPESAWNEFRAHRKAIKKPMSDIAENKTIVALGRLRDEGNDPVAVLDQSMANGWQGVFEVKNGSTHRQSKKSAGAVSNPAISGYSHYDIPAEGDGE